MPNQKHFLITGIPGMGKTTIGQELATNYGFDHRNFEEQAVIDAYGRNPQRYISDLLSQDKNVITWGFMPYHQANHVLELKRKGFVLIWFDGNRPAAFREFMRRGTVSETAFLHQLSNISSSDVISLIKPNIINTFDNQGRFKTKDTIIQQILALA